MSGKNKNTGCGCFFVFVVIAALIGLPALGFKLADRFDPPKSRTHVAAVTTPATTPTTPPATTATPATTTPATTPPPATRPVTPTRPVTTSRAPAGRGGRQTAPVDDPFYVGYCSPTGERIHAQYARLAGAQTALRGKVVLVHLLVDAPGVHISDADRERIQMSAFAVQKLYEREAQRYGIDLSITTIPWPISTSIAIPPLTPGERDVLPDQTARALEAAVKKGLFEAEQETLASTEKHYKEQGYDHVAFLAYLPAASSSRSFANAHGNRDPTPGLAFVFESGSVVAMASVAAHEGLHLFGADDLYRLSPYDDADDHDIMSACRGFSGNGIEEATAWGIGWLREPPSRRYRF